MDMHFIRERERESTQIQKIWGNKIDEKRKNRWTKKIKRTRQNESERCTMHGVIWSLQARLFFSQVFSPNWRDCILMGLKKKTSKPHQFLPIFFSYQTYQNIIFPPFFFLIYFPSSLKSKWINSRMWWSKPSSI